VQTKLSKEIYQLKQRLEWCQAQSLKRELHLQSQNFSKTCQIRNDNELFKSQCLKYENEIAELKIENAEWQQNHDEIAYCNGKFESQIQDKNHIIIELKEKIKLLEKGKFVDTTVIAPGMYQIDKTDRENDIQTSNENPSTSTGIVSTNSVSISKRKGKKKNRILQRKRGTLEAQEVEDQLRNLNKNHVASELDSNLANCNQNLSVTNDEPLNVLNINASYVFCRKSVYPVIMQSV
jgi:hypothetical protein